MRSNITPSGKELFFNKDEIIVSKTDTKGLMTYTNRVFIRLAGYTEQEIIRKPHSLIRHPSMPKSIFKLLWSRIKEKKEIFAYVVNLCKNGDHYWVLAHVTPSFDENGQVNGYHSNRRVPDHEIIKNTIIPLYKQLMDEEKRHQNHRDGMNAAINMLQEILQEKGMSYDEFIFSLQS